MYLSSVQVTNIRNVVDKCEQARFCVQLVHNEANAIFKGLSHEASTITATLKIADFLPFLYSILDTQIRH